MDDVTLAEERQAAGEICWEEEEEEERMELIPNESFGMSGSRDEGPRSDDVTSTDDLDTEVFVVRRTRLLIASLSSSSSSSSEGTVFLLRSISPELSLTLSGVQVRSKVCTGIRHPIVVFCGDRMKVAGEVNLR